MSKILFINQPSIGHLNPLLNIALQMRDDGHQPKFLVPGIKGRGADSAIDIIKTAALIPQILEQHGLPVETLRPPLLAALILILLTHTAGYTELMLAIETASLGIKNYCRELLKYFAVHQPDIIVTDFAFIAAHIAAERANIPCVTIYHTGLPFKGRLIPPFGSGLPIGENAQIDGQKFARRERFIWQRLDRRVNNARDKLQLPAAAPDLFCRPYSQWLNLIASAAAIEAPRDNLTDTTFFIGPCFSQRKGITTDFPFSRLQADKYKIYVSLGTVFNNRPAVFRKIMSALNRPDYQVIISAGGAFAQLQSETIPENVLLFDSVPQVDLLPLVDLVIGHGGNNSLNETLAAGKPVIIMPIGGEQCDNARRVEYLQVGAKVDITSFNQSELAEQVDTIRANRHYQQRAEQLKAALIDTDGARTASTLIAWLAEHKRPLRRPDNFPLTIDLNNLSQLLRVVNERIF